MKAAFYDHHAIVGKLVDARADVNIKETIGGCALRRRPVRRRVGRRRPTAPAPSGRYTALHIAARYGSTKSAVPLLVGGADPTLTNNFG